MRFAATLLCALLALAGVFRSDDAKAAVAGTGTFEATFDTTVGPPHPMTGTITWNNESRTVFDRTVNLGTSVGTMDVDGSVIPGGGSGTYSGSADGSPDLSFDGPDGVFLSRGGLNFSLISSAVDLTGNLVGAGGSQLPPDDMEYAYTSDGADTCTIAPGEVSCSGTVALNAFEGQYTDATTPSNAAFSTTFFNPITGTEVPSTVILNFASVSIGGETQLTATSNAAGSIPSNFAIEAGTWRAAFLNITTAATYTPPIRIVILYPDTNDPDGVVDGTESAPNGGINECDMKLLHEENGTFTNVTLLASDSDCPELGGTCSGAAPRCIDTAGNWIYGRTTSLSPFVVAAQLPAPVPALSTRGALTLGGAVALAGAALIAVRRRAV